jgi:hypothetical protein
MARWTVREIADMPVVSEGDPDDPVWYPLQHVLGIDAFGVNLFVAQEAGQTLVEDHDERASGQQELYLVLEGRATFELDGKGLVSTAAQPLPSPNRPSDAAPKH